jgi:hypothetical protein
MPRRAGGKVGGDRLCDESDRLKLLDLEFANSAFAPTGKAVEGR